MLALSLLAALCHSPAGERDETTMMTLMIELSRRLSVFWTVQYRHRCRPGTGIHRALSCFEGRWHRRSPGTR